MATDDPITESARRALQLELLDFHVLIQYSYAEHHWEQIDKQIALPDGHDDKHNGFVYMELTGLLNAVANISKVFWMTSAAKTSMSEAERRRHDALKERCSRMRRRYGLRRAGEFLIARRDVRNDFEHLDTRIDEWTATSETLTFLDMQVGSRDLPDQTVDPQAVMRLFDPTPPRSVYTFGHRVDLEAVMDELEQIGTRALQLTGAPPPV